jgi:hypothetical protein
MATKAAVMRSTTAARPSSQVTEAMSVAGYPSGCSAPLVSPASSDYVPAPAMRRNMQPKSIA